MGSSYVGQIYETHFIWTRARNILIKCEDLFSDIWKNATEQVFAKILLAA